MKKEIFASLIVLLLIVIALSGCTDENIDNVDETNGTVDENGGNDENGESLSFPSSIPFFGGEEDFDKENDIASLNSEDWRGLSPIMSRTPNVFVWDLIEPLQGEFDFTLTDAVVSDAFDSWIVICAQLWPFASWDQEDKEECQVPENIRGENNHMFEKFPDCRCKPRDMGAYKSFLKELVERYDGDDDFGSYPIDDSLKDKIRQNPVIYWEIMNEVDDGPFFVGTLEDYVDILRNTYEAIKEVCEECQVIIAHAKLEIGVDETKDYYSSLVPLGAGDYFDIYHVCDPISVLEEVIGTLDKPVVTLESGGGLPSDMARIAITYAADGFSSCLTSMVPDEFKYGIKGIGGDPEKEEEFFKEYLLYKNGSKTLQYYALQTLTTELGYFEREKVEPYEAGDGVSGFKFYFEDKAPVYVFFIGEMAWAVDDPALQLGNEEETVVLDFEQFLVKDLYGNEEVKSQSFTLEWSNVYFVTEISNQGTD